MTKKYLFLLIAILLSVGNLFAQSTNSSSKSFFDNTEINYSLGFSQFYGDASSNGYFKKFSGEIGFAQNLALKKHVSPVFAYGINFYYGCLKSHKTSSGSGTPVDFSLLGNYGDISLKGYIDFNSLFWGRNYNRRINVFGWLGLGYAFWNTGLTNNTNGDYIQSGGTIATGSTETFKKGGLVMPAGFGVNYRINPNWAVNVVGDFKTIFNDDVDVWRGGAKNDHVFYTGFGVSYYINPGFGSRKRKTKTNKAPKRAEYDENKKEENVIKPETKDPEKPRKLISDVPIFDLDYKQANRAKENIAKQPVPDVLEVKPTKKVEVIGVVYRVQILAKSQALPNVSTLKNRYNIKGDIYVSHQNGLYRYNSGEFNNFHDAVRYSAQLKSQGVSDAFVVVYKDGVRIPLTSDLKK